jgi:hypothetical protein
LITYIPAHLTAVPHHLRFRALFCNRRFGYGPRIFSEALESIRMKQLIALIMIAFLVPTAALAKNNACKEDKTKFCKDAKAEGAHQRG